jgi:hypothetical protein
MDQGQERERIFEVELSAEEGLRELSDDWNSRRSFAQILARLSEE